MKKIISILCFGLIILLVACSPEVRIIGIFSTETMVDSCAWRRGNIIRSNDEFENILEEFPEIMNNFSNRFFQNYGLIIIGVAAHGRTNFTLEIEYINFRPNGLLYVLLYAHPVEPEDLVQQSMNKVVVIRVNRSVLNNIDRIFTDVGWPM